MNVQWSGTISILLFIIALVGRHTLIENVKTFDFFKRGVRTNPNGLESAEIGAESFHLQHGLGFLPEKYSI